MRWCALFRLVVLFSVIGALQAADFVSWKMDGNIARIELSDGSAELEWLSTSTFRFSRRWGPAAPTRQANKDKVDVMFNDRGASLRFDSSDITVIVEKKGLLVRATEPGGKALLHDVSEMTRTDGVIHVERASPVAEQFFGLGARASTKLNARGSNIVAQRPFLLSSLGYALHHPRAGEYRFDLASTKPDHYSIAMRGGNRFEYVFHHGSTPKEIMESHLKVSGQLVWEPVDMEPTIADKLPRYASRMPAVASPDETPSMLINAALSGMLVPAMTPEVHGPLAYLMPLIYSSGSNMEVPAMRKRLLPYLGTYIQEARDRGFPVIHPFSMQFTEDAKGKEFTDQFMLGDEIMVATGKSAYLPRGNWTDFEQGRLHPGRRVINLDASYGSPTLFARNGSILPFAGEPFELHYYPKLAAEFFLFEADEDAITQIHAAPAVDIYRFEIESLKDRTYEWTMHHAGTPVRVWRVDGTDLARVATAAEMTTGAWHYDEAKKLLRFRLHSAANSDEIINVQFKEDVF